MINIAKRLALVAVSTVCLAAGLSTIFQPSFALTNGGSITALGDPLTENFDSLASAGTTNPWADNTTISGWYSTRTVYIGGTGSLTNGGLYSFGVAGTNPSTDRALGSIASGTTTTVFHAARLTNNTGSAITSLDITYVGEQWRHGGATAPAVSLAQTVDFQYQVANAGVVTGANIPATGWLDHDALDFTSPTFGTSAPAALDGNAGPNRLQKSATLSITIASGQEVWLRWRDIDNTGNDHGLAIDDFSVTANGPADSAPTVTGTTPANSATNIAVDSDVVITFSESVNAAAGAFAIECPTGSAQAFSPSASPGTTFTLNPTSDLPYSTSCTVTVTADQITDTDGTPDPMALDFSFSFTTADADPPPPVATGVVINEVDADTPGADTAEFVELYDGGAGNTSLTGLAVVFYNGSNSLSYAAFDLDGLFTDANGYFTLGNSAVTGSDLVFADNLLQNGADAVALYAGDGSSFPTNTPVTTTNLQDAVVYDTDDADAPGLLTLLNAGQPQVNENGGGSGTTQSSQRCPNGSGGARNTATYSQDTPTPDGASICTPPPPPFTSVIVVSQLYGGGGNTEATYQNDYVELYNRGTATVDIGGWSLQYASSTGSGWDFNKQPLGGTIAPGEYYLIALASGGAAGASLPPANVSGQINMSATNGKIALVGNFAALVGNCPLADPDLMDLVGYGNADCQEGAAAASAPGNATALFRQAGGGTDTDENGNDFVLGSPAPRRTAPIVELGPQVLSTDPRTNGFNAPRDATIQVTFTEPVDVDGAWFEITCATTGPHNSATFTFAGSGQAHYITPNDNFLAGEQCTVTLAKDQIHDQDSDDTAPNTDTLPANYSWSFTVASGTAPPYPASVHLTMGNPSDATADIGQPNNFLMEKPEFSLSYDEDLGRPNWVSWHLSDEWIGSLTRVDTFRADPAVPASWYRVQSFDFSGSGFDRGHMVPNADRDKETSVPINQATFLMSNMIAQAPDNNQGPWEDFESYLRTLLPLDEVYIVAGGVGSGGVGGNGGVTMTLADGNVTVPAQTWKVALVIPKAGGDDISRVTCSSRSIAVIMPNTQGIRTDTWDAYLTKVDTVEALTGYDLFSNLPQAIQACVEARMDGDPPLDLDTLPPTVDCGSPDAAWHADNVALGCTASDSGSGLANAGDASFSLITSVADGSEDANASTDSRLVCDVAGNCATAGPIAGNRIDRKDPEITLTTPPNGAVYQLNRVVNAAYSCADSGSGSATCAGTVANGAAIDTSSAGAKSFVVNATDGAGNGASASVTYTVVANTISISNIPAQAFVGGSFAPTFAYAGDGATSVTSNTPGRCTVSGGTVTFVHKGTCTLVAHAAGTASFDPATGSPQSFTIDKQTTTISINNLPGAAVNGGSFTPTFAYTGDGITHTRSETPAICRIHQGVVRLVGGGTCTLTARASATGLYDRAIGDPQSFVVGPATTTIEIKNVPAKPKVGKSFVPHFRYDGDGQTSVTSSTPAICGVTGAVVTFLAPGTCTLTAHATATANYAEATGVPESFLVKATW